MVEAQFDELKLQQVRAQLSKYVEDGQLDQSLIKLLFSGTYGAPVECELLDYKECIEDSKLARAKAIIPIVSLYNTFGGYLVYGVKEQESEITFKAVGVERGSIDVESIKALLNEYTGERIGISLQFFQLEDLVTPKDCVAILYVPRRTQPEPLAFGRDGPGDPKGRPIFLSDDVYYRKNDECVIAKGRAVMFLAGPRPSPFRSLERAFDVAARRQARLQNNLPERSFICERFIGRRETIDQLWSWFADDFSHVRVLAGEGGLGKTSIAYQFAEEVCSSEESSLERVVWLTAKTKQFSGVEGRYVDVPETHFRSYTELLKVLCEELGYLTNEIEDASERLLKHRIAEGARITPCLVVVDDVDSLEANEQRKVQEIGFIFSGGRSRLLITTRMNQSYSNDIAIQIKGFLIEEYYTFVESLSQRYAYAKLSRTQIEAMHSATGGSPMFTEALYRHMRWMNFSNAVTNWRGKLGEEARAAALQREIDVLTPEAKRVLLATAYLRDCSYSELSEASGYPDEILSSAVDELASLYLLAAPHFTDERRFQVTTNTQQFVTRIQDNLAADHSRLLERVKELRRADQAHKIRRENPIVGAAISQALGQLRRGEVERAIDTIDAAERQYANNSDLKVMRARLLLRVSPPRFDDARLLARAAYQDGNRKSILFEVWYESESLANHFNGAVEAADCALKSEAGSEPEWRVRSAAAYWNLAKDEEGSGNVERAIGDYWLCDRELGIAMEKSINTHEGDLLHQRFLAHDSVWSLLSRRDPERVSDAARTFDEVLRMVKAGDVRLVSYVRLCESLTKMRDVLVAQGIRLEGSLRNLIDQRISQANVEFGELPNRHSDISKIQELQVRMADIQRGFGALYCQDD